MTFLHSWALGFAAIAPVIVLLYLLKLKRREMPVSTLIFWQQVLQENRRRALFQRLRQLLSLLLHLLIFTLLLGALARPILDRAVREGASTVLILDTRARMQALEPGGESRFEKARALAAAVLREAGPQQQIAILTAGAGPAVVAAFSSEQKTLRQRLDELAPTDATGNLDAAIHLANDLLASRKGDRRIIVLTDAQSTQTATQHSTLNTQLSYLPTGSARDNIAITHFATRPLLNSPQTSEALVEIANFGRSAARGNLEIAFDGRVLDVKPFAIEPGARKSEIFPIVPRASAAARGWLTARLDKPDALAADNAAYAVLPPRPPSRVLLVTRGNWFLEKLLAADQSIAFELLAPDGFQLALAAKFDAVVLDNFLPQPFDFAQTPGNFFFIKQTPFPAAGAPLEQPLISETDAQHPAMRLVNLQNVTFLRAAPLALPGVEGWKWQAPIRSFDHPLMITGERRGAVPRRLAALALDVTDSDLPLRVAFPLLISNTLHWLASERAAAAPSAIAGETIPLPPGSAASVKPQTPSAPASSSVPLASTAKTARAFFQPLKNGFYEIADAEGARWIAVNTFSEAESDIRIGSAPSPVAPDNRAIALATFARVAGWPLWQYLALAAFALFTLEWWLFHRRRTE